MNYIIKGKVIKGDGYGKKIGFPTANLDRRDFLRLKEKPKFGVWSGITSVNNKIYKSAIVIGPNDKVGLPKIEAHLINFSGNIYGKKLNIEVCKFIRSYKKFKTEKDLIIQIQKDILKCN